MDFLNEIVSLVSNKWNSEVPKEHTKTCNMTECFYCGKQINEPIWRSFDPELCLRDEQGDIRSNLPLFESSTVASCSSCLQGKKT